MVINQHSSPGDLMWVAMQVTTEHDESKSVVYWFRFPSTFPCAWNVELEVCLYTVQTLYNWQRERTWTVESFNFLRLRRTWSEKAHLPAHVSLSCYVLVLKLTVNVIRGTTLYPYESLWNWLMGSAPSFVHPFTFFQTSLHMISHAKTHHFTVYQDKLPKPTLL